MGLMLELHLEFHSFYLTGLVVVNFLFFFLLGRLMEVLKLLLLTRNDSPKFLKNVYMSS